ncbi:MAG: hypothetical protein F6J97_06330 [Leptolyngbya sp. SIO4C1]|nr:hypothetical protein [Leptolyngbya sp. SIO4C1]
MSTEIRPSEEPTISAPEEPVALPPEEPVTVKGTHTEPLEADTQDAFEQVKRVSAQVFDRLGETPDYLLSIFSEYKRPITVIGLVLGALIAVKMTFAILGAINDIPVLAPTLELIGLLYSGWFIYRYLLKAETRRELVSNLNSVKDQVIGRNS